MTVLDNYLKAKRDELRQWKKEVKQLKDKPNERNKLEYMIDERELHLRKFMKSRMEPALFGDIVINNKVYERFMKTLKGMYHETTFNGKDMVVYYGKNAWHPTIGKLVLHDLSHYFEGYGKITKQVKLYD